MPGPGSYLVGEEEIKEVMDVMESGHLFRYGDMDDPDFKHKVYTLEEEFAEYCGTPYAIATSSGSSSLLIPLFAIGSNPGDEVIVPAYTFVASYSTIIFAGFTPVLAEIDESLTLDPKDVENRITSKTRAIMPVHMLGNPCKMNEILEIAEKHNLVVIEDCCQAAGASYRGKKVGTMGLTGGYSLNVFKTITAGDGGMIITSDKEMYEHMFAIHDQGHTPARTGVQVGERNILGLNFRANEVTGAVALAQLRKIDLIISMLQKKKQKFKDLISTGEGFRFRSLNDEAGAIATVCTVIFESKEKADRICKALGTDTVDHSGWHVYANMEHVLHYFKEIGRPIKKGSFPVTDDILSHSINISIGVVDGGLGAGWGLNIHSTDEEIEQKAEAFLKACNG
jgi:8-amino-3,8-dideoxy-alpha-D-manno-octulosonate transaminase